MRHSSAPLFLCAFLQAFLLLPAPGASRADRSVAGIPRAPTLAVEDTFNMPTTTLPEYLVEADRVTLDEILRRVAEGEARRDSLMRDQTYTLLFKIVYLDASPSSRGDARIEREYVSRVFKKRPGKVHEIPLRSEGDDDIEVRAGPQMGEDIVSFAFEPKSRAQYSFEILERNLVGGHVVYKIKFRPRSSVDPLPTGMVWIDTNEFVILREEFWFRDRSPRPLFIKSIDRCVVERSLVEGRWWVMTGVMARFETTSLLRLAGKIAGKDIPATIDMVLEKTDWKINSGLPDSLFASGSR